VPARAKPRCFIIAGPNGAGKTTFARRYVPGLGGSVHFINADLIAAGLSPFEPQLAAVAAGRLVLRELTRLVAAREDFAFESTLSGLGFENVYKPLATAWTVYDNSGQTSRLKDRGP
jgi:predicted ABC-type ATPase